MPTPLPAWLRRIAVMGRLLVVAFVLAGQVASGAVARPGAGQSDRARLQAAMVLCVGDHHPAKDGQAPVHAHHQLPAIAAGLHDLAQLAALVDVGTAVVPPRAARAGWRGRQEARAPPARYAIAAYPTGPPHTLI